MIRKASGKQPLTPMKFNNGMFHDTIGMGSPKRVSFAKTTIKETKDWYDGT